MRRLFNLFLSVMRITKLHMRRMISKQLQVFRPIVLFIFNRTNRIFYSFMMNFFWRDYKATYNFFHNQMRTPNTSSFSIRMIRRIYKNISSRFFPYTTFPIVSFFPFLSKTNFSFPFRSALNSFMGFTYILYPFFREWRAFFTKMCKTYFSFMPFGFRFVFKKMDCITTMRASFSSFIIRFMRFKLFSTNTTFFQHCHFLLVFIITFNIVCCQVGNVWAVDNWDASQPAGTIAAADIDAYVIINNNALERILADYRIGCKLSYASASTLTVASGAAVASNSGGTVRRFRRNTTSTTVSWTNIESGGSEAASTTYYVYMVADNDTATFTVTISTSSTAPTSVTYYKRLGSFYNDASSNITQITDDSDNDVAFVKGTSNFYKIETGSVVIAGLSNSVVSFTTTFASAPKVFLVYNDTSATWAASVSGVTTTTATIYNNTGESHTLDYIIVGQVLAQ